MSTFSRESQQLNEIVFSYPPLVEHLASFEEGADRQKARGEAEKYLLEIRAEFSPSTINALRTFLDGLVKKLYDSIQFNSQTQLDFRKLVEENHVVLVPNHQSHADYIAINYVVYKMFKFPLYVAGGINLNIFPIGKLFKKCGCFFIRRTFGRNILYKLTLEGYLYYLLIEQRPIEFFFEGGRSRTGKLMPPRFGLYSMVLDAYKQIPEDRKRPLKFVPVSIVHEVLPEQSSMSRELRGGKKRKESTSQLIKVLGILSHQFGSVHIRLGKIVDAPKLLDEQQIKKVTQNLAFECFFQVGKNMTVTPSSLLALILLDAEIGSLSYLVIEQRAKVLIQYCIHAGIPLSHSLSLENEDDLRLTLLKNLELWVSQKKIQRLKSPFDLRLDPKKIEELIRSFNQEDIQSVFVVTAEQRLDLLYFKNTILHHFIVPWMMSIGWANYVKGEIKDAKELKDFLVEQRKRLKFEFYLPPVRDMMLISKEVMSFAIGRKVESLEDYLTLPHRELFGLGRTLALFARSFHYILESQLMAIIAFSLLTQEQRDRSQEIVITSDKLFKKVDELYQQLKNGNSLKRDIWITCGLIDGQFPLLKFPEGNHRFLCEASVKWLVSSGAISEDSGQLKLDDEKILQRELITLSDLLQDKQLLTLSTI